MIESRKKQMPQHLVKPSRKQRMAACWHLFSVKASKKTRSVVQLYPKVYFSFFSKKSLNYPSSQSARKTVLGPFKQLKMLSDASQYKA
jgi:hypothetical protein